MNVHDTSDPVLWLRGETTALGPFVRELVELYWRWEQEPRSLVGYGRPTPESLEARVAGYESQARSMHQQTRFTVYELVPDGAPRPVGTAALRIDQAVRTAEYVLLLGAEGRGRGLGTEVTTLVLDYAFHVVNLRAVWVQVLEPNVGAITVCSTAGFRLVGRRRRSGYWLGRECAEIIMDAVPDDLPGPSRVVDLVGGRPDPDPPTSPTPEG